MKNENIHAVFSQREIRDFLAQELRQSEREGGASVEYIGEQIEKLQQLLKHAKNAEAILRIIESNGWQEWDISDDIPYNRQTYFPFLGTEEEYNKLLEMLKKEKGVSK